MTRRNLIRLAMPLGFVLTMAHGALAALSPVEIMSRNYSVSRPQGMVGRVNLVVQEPNGDERTLDLRVWTKLHADGVHASIKTRFVSPPDLRDTSFLEVEAPRGGSTAWVFLSSLNKVRRLPTAEKRNSFFGTEYTYADVLVPEVDAFEHSLVGEETVDGVRCYVVESFPRDPENQVSELGYQRRRTWIDASSFLDRKVHYLDADGKLLRVQRSSDPHMLDKDRRNWLMMSREMKNVVTGRKTLLQYRDVEYVPTLKDAVFTPRSLQDSE